MYDNFATITGMLHYQANEGGSSSVSDTGFYVIIRELLDSVFNILPVFTCQWNI
jgi:hypothetical protein